LVVEGRGNFPTFFEPLSFLSILAFLPSLPWYQIRPGFCLKKTQGFCFLNEKQKTHQLCFFLSKFKQTLQLVSPNFLLVGSLFGWGEKVHPRP